MIKKIQYYNRGKLKNHYLLALFIILTCILTATVIHARENNSFQETTLSLNRKEVEAYLIHGRLRFSFQNVKITDNEKMGLYSFHYDLFNVWKLFPGIFLSIGGYGAFTGDRGGFLVGGYGAGYNFKIMKFFGLETGVFFGGGGGAPQGSGLMLQQYIAFQITVLGAGLHIIGSNINFPDGDIGSRQIAAGFVFPIKSWISIPTTTEKTKNYVSKFYAAYPMRILVSPKIYFPGSDSRLITQIPLSTSIGLIGFGMEHYFSPRWFTKFNFHGALYGNVAGYAQILTGIGYSLFSIKKLETVTMMQAGAGGGGAVHTGGGFLIKPSIGIRAPLFKDFGLFFDTGYTYAPGGYFGALSLETGIIREIIPLAFKETDPGKLIPGYVKLDHWKILVLNKTFFPSDQATLKSGIQMESVIQLVGFALYHPITRHLNWTGQAFGAWYGGIGGYAEGLLGFEVHIIPFKNLQRLEFSASMLGGAAGGGVADTGSGIIWETAAGITCNLSNRSSIVLESGFLDAVKGSLQGIVLRFGLAVDFSIPENRGLEAESQEIE